MADKQPDYKGFARWAVQEGPWDGKDLDGYDVQCKAIEFGVIKEVAFDPDVHGADDEYDTQPGDPWYVFAEK